MEIKDIPIIAYSGDITPLPGDFMAVVSQGVLYVPKEIKIISDKYGVPRAGSLYQCISAFPQVGLEAFEGWNIEDVIRANEKLRDTLEGHVSEEILNYIPKQDNYGRGALDPKLNSKKIK